MRTALRAALTTKLHPAFFGLTCLLLISVSLKAKVLADEVAVAQDNVNAYYYYFEIPSRFPWLAAN